MAKGQNTYEKRAREMAKKQKAEAKRERQRKKKERAGQDDSPTDADIADTDQHTTGGES